MKEFGQWKEKRFERDVQDSEGPAIQAQLKSADAACNEFESLQQKLNLRANDREM